MTAVVFNLYDQYRLYRHSLVTPAVTATTIKVMIVTSVYAPNQNTDSLYSDVSANEVTGTGYTAGGNACASPNASMDGAGLITINAGDPAVWTQNAGGFSNGRRVIIYDSVSGRLIGYSASFVADQGNVAGDFSVVINVAGIYNSAR